MESDIEMMPPFSIFHRAGKTGWSHFLSTSGFTGVNVDELTYPALVTREGVAAPCEWAQDGTLRCATGSLLSPKQIRELGLAVPEGVASKRRAKPWWKFW